MTVRSHPPGPRISRLVPLLGVLCLATLEPVASHAQSLRFKFTKIADRNTPIPGATVNFDYFSPPSLEADRIAFGGFSAFGPNRPTGVYTALIGGPLMRVADTTMGVPGPVHSLLPIHVVSIDGERMALGGFNSVTKAVYGFANGAIEIVADTSTPIPSGTGNFALLSDFGGTPSADRGQVAFVGTGEQMQNGIYIATNGGLQRVVDRTTPIPDDIGNFQTLSSVVLEDGQLVFVGTGANRSGVYLYDVETDHLTRVADTTTTVPDRNDSFTRFRGARGIDVEGGKIAFIANSQNVHGVYLFDSNTGTISTIADTNTPIPGGDGSLFAPHYFEAVSIDNGHVALQYGTSYLQTQAPTDQVPLFGVYTSFEGTLEKLIANGDMLEGERVYLTEIGPESLDDDQIAMNILVGGRETIYVATLIPEPATLALTITALGFVALVAYRRSRSALPRRP